MTSTIKLKIKNLLSDPQIELIYKNKKYIIEKDQIQNTLYILQQQINLIDQKEQIKKLQNKKEVKNNNGFCRLYCYCYESDNKTPLKSVTTYIIDKTNTIDSDYQNYDPKTGLLYFDINYYSSIHLTIVELDYKKFFIVPKKESISLLDIQQTDFFIG